LPEYRQTTNWYEFSDLIIIGLDFVQGLYIEIQASLLVLLSFSF